MSFFSRSANTTATTTRLAFFRFGLIFIFTRLIIRSTAIFWRSIIALFTFTSLLIFFIRIAIFFIVWRWFGSCFWLCWTGLCTTTSRPSPSFSGRCWGLFRFWGWRRFIIEVTTDKENKKLISDFYFHGKTNFRGEIKIRFRFHGKIIFVKLPFIIFGWFVFF